MMFRSMLALALLGATSAFQAARITTAARSIPVKSTKIAASMYVTVTRTLPPPTTYHQPIHTPLPATTTTKHHRPPLPNESPPTHPHISPFTHQTRYDNYAQTAYVNDRERRLTSPETVRLDLCGLRWRSLSIAMQAPSPYHKKRTAKANLQPPLPPPSLLPCSQAPNRQIFGGTFSAAGNSGLATYNNDVNVAYNNGFNNGYTNGLTTYDRPMTRRERLAATHIPTYAAYGYGPYAYGAYSCGPYAYGAYSYGPYAYGAYPFGPYFGGYYY